jgi:hypothetical protein
MSIESYPKYPTSDRPAAAMPKRRTVSAASGCNATISNNCTRMSRYHIFVKYTHFKPRNAGYGVNTMFESQRKCKYSTYEPENFSVYPKCSDIGYSSE